MLPHRIALTLTCWLFLGPAAAAQGVLTTTFASNNAYSSSGAGHLFDLEVTQPAGLKILAFHVNSTAPTIPVTDLNLDVYLALGGHAGKATDPSQWLLVSSGSGTGAGRDQPTVVDVDDFFLAPGVYGLYLVYRNPAASWIGPAYTSGPGANQVYSNADLKLTMGEVQSQPFAGSRFLPRVWNGSILYDRHTAAGSGGYGTGCQGSGGATAGLSLGAAPVLGTTVPVEIGGLPQPTSAGWLLAGGARQSLELTSLGAPGCTLRLQAAIAFPFAGQGGGAVLALRVPGVPSLLGAIAHLQAAVADPGHNALGVTTSPGLSLRLGN